MNNRTFKTKLETVPHKRGRRTFGQIVKYPSGRTAYIGFRRLSHAYRGGISDIAKAARDGIAAWTFDMETILFARRHAVDAIGVFIRETGDVYMISMDAITRPELGLMDKTCPPGGGYKRILFQNFRVKRCPVKI